ncbi:hypothetical protein [Paraburkholderia sp. GAS448]|uniref:hypothetical protein n=1 Tax=Paraburkholderia sp. GAS448 TaxID=3035136 RepID=UPI003D20406D
MQLLEFRFCGLASDCTYDGVSGGQCSFSKRPAKARIYACNQKHPLGSIVHRSSPFHIRKRHSAHICCLRGTIQPEKLRTKIDEGPKPHGQQLAV